MKQFNEYIVNEVKNKRLEKRDAIEFLRCMEAPNIHEGNELFLHPLLHSNTSNLAEQRFSSTFTGQEFFLADHVVKGQRVLPGVTYLEMARAAAEQAVGSGEENNTQICLKNIVWARPIFVEDKPAQVHIGIYPENNGEISYEVYSESKDADTEVVHNQGNVSLELRTEYSYLDIPKLQGQCNPSKFSSERYYELFKKMGLDYGPGHQGLKEVYVGSNQVLAKLSLPVSIFETQEQYVLHPSLMDSALQATLALTTINRDVNDETVLKLALPFSLEKLEIFDKCTTVMWAYIRYSEGSKADDKVQKFDIDLCNEAGKICIKFKNFSTRVLEAGVKAVSNRERIGSLMLQPCWKEQIAQIQSEIDYAQHLVILCDLDEISKTIEEQLHGVRCLALQSKQVGIDERFKNYAVQVFEEIQNILKEKAKGNTLVQIVTTVQQEHQMFTGISGLLKTARLENPKLIGQLIEIEQGENSASLAEKLKENSQCPSDIQIHYQNGKRLVGGWSEVETLHEKGEVPWKEQGVYLITGGAGGLGLIFAREIADKIKKATLIITGRSELIPEKQVQLKLLEEKGIKVEYKRVDVIKKQAVDQLIKNIIKQYGRLDGIVHGAGIIRDNFIVNKTTDEFIEVLAPKVSGLVNLDQASSELQLDFFIVFSSIAGGLGNLGQADYATSNAFMDAYAKYRNELVTLKKRQGQTLAINWPLWKDGGMYVSEQIEAMMMQNLGMKPMQTATGIKAFYQGLASEKDQVMVIEGLVNKMRGKLIPHTKKSEKRAEIIPGTNEGNDGNLKEKVQGALLQMISKLLKVNSEDIDEDGELSEYGFDSITFTEFANALNQEYKLELAPTIFFEYPTLSSFVQYLVEEHKEVFDGQYTVQNQPAIRPEVDGDNLKEKVQGALLQMISKLLKVNSEDIDEDGELSEYGFDSITFTEFANTLNQEYKLELAPTIFFEYPTLSSFVQYLVEEHKEVFGGQSELAEQPIVQAAVEETVQQAVNVEVETLTRKRRHSRFTQTVVVAAPQTTHDESLEPKRVHNQSSEPIAIVGISGKFPKANDLNEFWINLVEGQDCISEIPLNRWDWREYYGDPQKEANKTNAKWGGFIDGVDEFDPLFFGLSPKEAELMDPQQRLLMMHVWKAVEDAGHLAQDLSDTKMGVFVGTGNTGYNGLLSRANVPIDGYTATGTVPSMGPNRLSYFLNIHGPSEPIETACSSSLIAIHRAVSAIKDGTCEMAIAGGVNTIIMPELHLSFSKAGMLSKDGHCKTFSDQANGYVRGEGVGMLFLKKLKDAEADGDHIYAVIRGSAENHGGRANSLTAPNPKAQAEVIKDAYTKAGIDPRTVTYIEAHGTGTKLGDPIEINGLKMAFADLYQASGDSEVVSAHCGLGSVKTNIGHLELAAGVASILKVLLQLEHKTLVKNLHCDTINPYIQLEDSPFYILRENKEWKALTDENGKAIPRRAGVSSFGFGGANAHIVVEEYLSTNEKQPSLMINAQHPAIIVLSAKNEECLEEQVKQLSAAIQSGQYTDDSLVDMAYTLQVGREAMDARLAVTASSIKNLVEKLEKFLVNKESNDGLYYGQVKNNKDTLKIFADEDMAATVDTWVAKEKYEKILDVWVKGFNFDWNRLYVDTKPRRISLPTYQFAKEKYWAPKSVNKGNGATPLSGANFIHPLLHQNVSTLAEQRFSSIFTGQEFFLADHKLRGQQVLPEVAYLEMARAAIEQSAVNVEEVSSGVRFKNVVWTHPVIVENQPVQVYMGLYPNTKGEIDYEIYSQSEDEVIVHNEGSIQLNTAVENSRLDIQTLQGQCSVDILDSSQFYESYSEMEFEYGEGYKSIEKVYVGLEEVFAKVSLPMCLSHTQDQFVLNPSVMNATMQAAYALTSKDMANTKKDLVLPISLREFEIVNPCANKMWVYVRYSEGSEAVDDGIRKLDVDLCDEHGLICVRMKDLEMQGSTETVHRSSLSISPQQIIQDSKTQDPFELMTFKECWQEEILQVISPNEIKTIVCFLSDPESKKSVLEAIQTHNQQTKVIFLTQSLDYNKHSKFEYSISPDKRRHYEEAFTSIQDDFSKIDAVLYLWALEDQKCIQNYTNLVYILQGIAFAKLKVQRILAVAEFENGLERSYLESWIGFERSLGLVLPNTNIAVIYQAMHEHNQATEMKDWIEKLWMELHTAKLQSVWYQQGKRYIQKIRPTEIQPEISLLKSKGTYLITGGCGGLGYLFAQRLADKYSANLVLIGRTPIDEAKQSKLKILEELGSQVIYVQADVCSLKEMKQTISQAKERFGGITGVIHAAGIEESGTILAKEMKSFQEVLEPKITGTLVLDEVLEEEPIDFICYFSSSSAILGDFGSCDYAIANRFQMAYGYYRNQLQVEGLRRGKTIVVNWPLWKDGGMGLDSRESAGMYLKSSGQRFLETREGVDIFERLLAQKETQHLLLVGQRSRVERFLGLVDKSASLSSAILSSSSGKGRRTEMKGLSLEQCLEWDLKEKISNLLKIARDKLDRDENLADFGFDSISLADFAVVLTNHYGLEITPSVFFGHPTIKELVKYFLTKHSDTIREFYKEDTFIAEAAASPKMQIIKRNHSQRTTHSKSRFVAGDAMQSVSEPIAIIGMSGRFPQARNIDEMWQIIVDGEDVVQEIPQERFDWHQYYGDPKKDTRKTNCKWCGCVPGVDEFDPLFFEISPKEAETMDPRQRLLLQEAWNALEDAGYGTAKVKSSKIGMFVGVEDGDYDRIVKENGSLTSNHNAILASRLAYFLNLNGPVMAINTACSSGLVAAHQACLSLRNKECDTAIAAGVNLLLTPEPFIAMSQVGMLSEDGRCFAFDKRANGMVPGEAVAVVIFKRLSQAERDGDPIYAVIHGSGINYDGKTNGITAPSGVSQANLLKDVYENKINPEEIEYIVTHGTGTKLGDPIEINALYDAFKEYTKKQGYCALTSTKTNFGHTMAASGLVSLIGLVQALQHEMIPASLHCEQENDYIQWQESPFYVNKTNKPWKQIGRKKRTGAVSAFGMGGTNAHMVVQSYIAEEDNEFQEQAPYYLFVFSAKTQEALQEKVKDFINNLENKNWDEQNLFSISYTLLEGRQHFNHRCAVVVQDLEDAIYILKKVGSKESLPNLFYGKVSKNFTGQKLMRQYVQELQKQSQSIKENKSKYQEILCTLADFYCQGYEIGGKEFYGNNSPHCIRIPTYPFAREHYWVTESESSDKGITTTTIPACIHPLVQRNTSTFSEQRFSSNFTGQEDFLKKYVLQGQGVLPGMAYLEMIWAAVMQASESADNVFNGMRITNVVWGQPITLEQRLTQVNIGLFPENNGEIVCEIYTAPAEGNTESIVHCQSRVVQALDSKDSIVNISALQAQCNQKRLDFSQCNAELKKRGINLAQEDQGIEEVYVGTEQVLAKVFLPSCKSEIENKFTLHPILMNAILQAPVFLMRNDGFMNKTFLPLALKSLDILGRCTPTMWVLIHNSDDYCEDGADMQNFDIDLYDEKGNICICMKGLSLRVWEDKLDLVGVSQENFRTLLLQPYWKEQNISLDTIVPEYKQHLVILCEQGENFSEKIGSCMKGVHCIALQSDNQNIAERFQFYTIQIFEEIQSILKANPTGKLLIQIVIFPEGEQQFFSGLSGLLKTAQLENPKLIGQLIEVNSGEEAEVIIEKLKENRQSPMDDRIRYRDGKRWVAEWREIEAFPEKAGMPWRDRGIYLITGGAGGLGLIFAREIAHTVKEPTLILTGRSQLSEDKKIQLKELEVLGARVRYQQVDVTQEKEVFNLIQEIQDDFGGLHGIIHSAGVNRDNFILKKTVKEIQEVLAPKVTGLVNVDQASKNINLDFLICFSSVAGIFGNAGQLDYAAANAFMNEYSEYRNTLVASKQRRGRTLSISWPLWKEGGMHVDKATEKMIRQNFGMIPMRTLSGIRALYQSIDSNEAEVMVLEGELPYMREHLLKTSTKTGNQRKKFVQQGDTGVLQEKVIHQLKIFLSEITKLNIDKIDATEYLETYGIDSIMITSLNQKLADIFGDLSKTLFYEYQTLEALAKYLVADYLNECMQWTGLVARLENPSETTSEVSQISIAGFPKLLSKKAVVKQSRTFTVVAPSQATREPIAIIGLSGRYPQANTLEAYWDHLKAGKDCITEIPPERWSLEGFYDSDKLKAVAQGKSYSKWGGFVKEFANFDPSFFNISYREALNMDPQERLFIESCWGALEDAGYTKEQLAIQFNRRIGVFAGVTKAGYNLYGPDFWKRGEQVYPYTSFGSVANRISYLLNLQGPSMPIDTMCSSSLTAIHEACEHIYRGECEMAFAGGVNLYLHPSSYIMLCAQQMLSADGKCRSFGEGSSGFVPGEGVGVALLKPLSKAITDGDHIYAVIRGTSINHGGKTNGYTVPNPIAQGELIRETLNKAGINARTVSYIEAHGTGTKLGDPIEITGLTQAFQKDTQDLGFCAIGSVKANIGHLEAAAGIAGITKIILQMKNQKLVPSLHAKKLNSNINFSKTPFAVQQELADWERPVLEINGISKEYPRIAAVSSFGAGGVNAHVVLEEYIPPETHPSTIIINASKPAIIVVSAKNEERLREQAQQLLAAITKEHFTDKNLADIAYTLQVGRESMEERLGFIVESVENLQEKLKSFVSGKDGIEGLYRGQVQSNKETLALLASDEDMDKTVEAWMAKEKYAKVLNLWVRGLSIDWNKLYGGIKPCRISLPTYPFAKEQYWMDKNNLNLIQENQDDKSQSQDEKKLQESEEILREVIEKNVSVSRDLLTSDVHWYDIGIDSIATMMIIQEILSRFDSLDLEKDGDFLIEYITGKNPRISELAERIEYRGQTKRSEADSTVPYPSDGGIMESNAEVATALSDMDTDCTMETELLNIIAEYMDCNAAVLSSVQTLSELGNDFVTIMRMAGDIVDRFDLNEIPGIKDELTGYMVEDGITIEGLSEYIKRRIIAKKNSFVGSLDINEINKRQKKNTKNILITNLQVNENIPSNFYGKILIDETHRFYFDHPLDHVSGIQLAEAMSQIAKSSFLYQTGIETPHPLFIPEISLSFQNYCQKEGDIWINACVEGSETNQGKFRVEVIQGEKSASIGKFTIQENNVLPVNEGVSIANSTKLVPCPKEIVNKNYPENILVSNVVKEKDGKEIGCYFVYQYNNDCFNDFPGEFVDTVVLLEACRQSCRVFEYDLRQQKDNQLDFRGLVPILKYLNIKIKRPIYKNETVFLKKDKFEIVKVGSNRILEMKGRILIGNSEVGFYENKSMAFTESFLSQVKNR